MASLDPMSGHKWGHLAKAGQLIRTSGSRAKHKIELAIAWSKIEIGCYYCSFVFLLLKNIYFGLNVCMQVILNHAMIILLPKITLCLGDISINIVVVASR